MVACKLVATKRKVYSHASVNLMIIFEYVFFEDIVWFNTFLELRVKGANQCFSFAGLLSHFSLRHLHEHLNVKIIDENHRWMSHSA